MKSKPTLTAIGGYLLDAGPNWDRYTPEARAEICNGVGPAAWPPAMRDALDQLPYLLPASRVHDVDYTAGDDEPDRVAADLRFRANCYRAARHKLGGFWLRLFSRRDRKRWAIAIALIEGAYLALKYGGQKAISYATNPVCLRDDKHSPQRER